MHTKGLVSAVACTVVASSAVGWFAGTHLKSPQQIAAESAPPEASLITVPVERRQLSSVVTTRGTVRFGQPQQVTLASSSLTGAQTTSLVTKAPRKGAVLGQDGVALEVSGRPVRVLQGAIPMYRDLRPGDEGQDVRQLEVALKRLGYRPGQVDGRYDVATEAAVERWYRNVGYRALGASEEQQEQLRSSGDALSQAEDQVLAAKERLATARKGPSRRDVAQAQADLLERRRSVARAVDLVAEAAGAANITTTTAERGQDGVTKARLDGQLAVDRAAADVASAEHRLSEAQDSLRTAQVRLTADLNGYADDDPDTVQNERRRIATDVQLDQDRADITRAQNAVAEAATELTNTRLGVEATRASADDGVEQAALGGQQATQAALQAAHAETEARRALESAKDAARLAVVTLRDLLKPLDLRSAQVQLDKARRDYAQAKQRLGQLSGRVGIVVPANELLFFPSLPLRVDESKVGRGDTVTKEVMVVTTSRLAVDGSLSLADVTLVKMGAKVRISAPDVRVETTGTVTRVAAQPGTNGVDSQRFYLEVALDGAPRRLTGASVAVSIAVAGTEGAIVAVPVAAVAVSSDGTSRVEVQGPGRKTHFVTVKTGLAAEGYVEVQAVRGTLRTGDRVVVGNRSMRAATS